MADDVVILGGARTPIGKFGGGLRAHGAVELGGLAIREAVTRTGVPADAVDLCVMGHARQAGNGPNPGRLMALAGGLPESVPVSTMQQACISGLLAVTHARYALREGDGGVAVAGGSENMSSIPYLSFETRWGARMGHGSLVDAMFKDGFIDPITGKHMGELCDAVGKRYGLTRTEQDEWACLSQARAALARKNGHIDGMLVPVPGKGANAAPLTEDEHARADTTLDKLARLPPAFGKDGVISAGNASGITDGACALVLATAGRARELGLRPRARILGAATAAMAPADFPIAPVASTGRLLDLGLDRERVNVWGGAIALGHPIGMSGARIVLYLVHALEATGGRYGLATLCGNGGHGASMVIERLG
ncbi:MAG: thiolase family protein [Candidatus Rokubacteria bacterium]|nr:thiolase family protein [Candidatus Rokubacteria bacterium]